MRGLHLQVFGSQPYTRAVSEALGMKTEVSGAKQAPYQLSYITTLKVDILKNSNKVSSFLSGVIEFQWFLGAGRGGLQTM